MANETKNIIKKCPQCKEEVQTEAKKCKHCQTDLRNLFARHPILLTIAVLFLIPFFITVFSDAQKTNTQSPEVTNKIPTSTIYSQAIDFMKQTLKSPSTANFPWLDYSVQKLGDDKYRIISYVDAQNSFGTEIRNNWIATLKYLGGDVVDHKNWTLEELIIDGEMIYPTK